MFKNLLKIWLALTALFGTAAAAGCSLGIMMDEAFLKGVCHG